MYYVPIYLYTESLQEPNVMCDLALSRFVEGETEMQCKQFSREDRAS